MVQLFTLEMTVALAAFVAVTCIVLWIAAHVRPRDARAARRFGQLAETPPGCGQPRPLSNQSLALKEFLTSATAVSITQRLMPSNQITRNQLQHRLIQAGVYRSEAM